MNKIGWCSETWNPCWGCKNNCEYCYARRIAKRFAGKIYIKEIRYKRKNNIEYFPDDYIFLWDDLKRFKPTFIHSHFNKRFPKKPQRIFVGSMSEIYHWEWGWVERVIEKVKQYPQHIFMFLTQHPKVYAQHLFASNCWYGVTMTRNKPIEGVGCIPTKKGIKFLSIEPILEKIEIEHIDDFEPDWIIVGAETGNRKEKVIPKKEWIEVIINFCNRTGVPLYLKDSLNSIFPYEIKEFPKK